MKRTLIAATIASALALAPGVQAQVKGGAVAVSVTEAVVKVTKIDRKARTVTVRGPKGNTVTIFVSTGLAKVGVPDVRNKDSTDAAAAIAALGLKPDVHQVYSTKDPGTVVMDLGTSVPRFDLLLASQYGTGIVNPNVEKQGKDQGHSYLQSHSAGTGAYMVQSAEPNNQIVLVRNPHYWGGWSGSHFKKIIIRQVPEDSDRRQGMESGDFDISFPSTPQDTT